MKMARISQLLKNDRRAKTLIKADVLKRRVYLQVGNLLLNLSNVEAKRVAKTVSKAVAIQQTESEK